jgi:REP element-mobilizing transposase RayT
MTTARNTQVSLAATPYYHCVARCVRRAFLCGEDPYTGKNFDHRKPWVVERLRLLCSVFTIDLCAYAIMSNHMHLVLRVDAERAQQLSDEQVVARYGKLFKGAEGALRTLPATKRRALTEVWRTRLMDISWMMRGLNEWVARRANREDGCTGRFWEGRFKSQALLDEEGLLTCMAYVDLNPIRAGIASRLESADYTSIQARLRAAKTSKTTTTAATSTPSHVAPMADDRRARKNRRLPIDLVAYVELLEWTGRTARTEGSGRLRGKPPELLTRFGFSPEGWSRTMQAHQLATCSALGKLDALDAEAARRGRAWIRGKDVSRRLVA